MVRDLLITILIVTMVSCGGSKTIQKTPEFRYAGATLSNGVSTSGNLGVSTNATNQFSTKDKAVFARRKDTG